MTFIVPSSEPHCRMVPMSSIDRTTPSVRQKPAASSRSCPGVRMITARLWPSTRISMGSSTTIQSEVSRLRPSRIFQSVHRSTESRGMHRPF